MLALPSCLEGWLDSMLKMLISAALLDCLGFRTSLVVRTGEPSSPSEISFPDFFLLQMAGTRR